MKQKVKQKELLLCVLPHAPDCNSVKLDTSHSGDYVGSYLVWCDAVYTKLSEERTAPKQTDVLFSYCCFLGLLFDTENGGRMFFRNVGKLY
jgi:hypothetical protein